MSKFILLCSSLLLILFIASCNKKGTSLDAEDGLASFSVDSLTQHIITLSSDEFQGRRPFTAGETRTVNYLASSFASLGLEPGNNGSYLQDVPMVENTSIAEPIMKVQSPTGSFTLKNMDDYVIWTENTEGPVTLSGDEVVFAGFGVVAPEYQWNDYAGLNVKGKVVMVMVNDPGYNSADSSLFKGKAMTYYGRWVYKFEEAARQGAKGCLIIHNTAAASYAFDVIQNSWGSAQIHLVRGGNEYRCPVEGWLTGAAARKLLAAGKQDTSLLSKANRRGFTPVPLGIKLSTRIDVKASFQTSKNVIGKITGSKYPDEYIIYSAHWDHFGIGKPDERGDSIYNGALDNATGTASILEIARAFRSMKAKPERSIVFLAVTAEEQGLLGSAYYAQHPVYPAEKTVANLNIDGINNVGPTKDVTISGAGQSELEDYLRREVESKGRYIAPEVHPEAGHYFRSDHFSFAKVGVPSLTISSGTDDIARGKSFGEKMDDEYTAKHYHRPSDEYRDTWNLKGGLEDIELMFLIGKRLSNDRNWPEWKAGSEFRALRKR